MSIPVFECAISEIVEIIGSIIKKKLRIVVDSGRRRPKTSEVERLFASNEKAKKLLKWTPRISLNEGLEKTVDWFSKRLDYFKNDLYCV